MSQADDDAVLAQKKSTDDARKITETEDAQRAMDEKARAKIISKHADDQTKKGK